MNRNPRKDANESDQNVHGWRKISYWKKYGVKRFPYPGRRRYTPSVYQSEDGGIIISNDVFGLTIRQFERTYKVCLDKRKAQEQYILNLRYPDKTSDEYMEYLENCTDCNTVYRSCNENDSKERYLYENVMYIVGTEKNIRKRQKNFVIKDRINNTALPEIRISSGSLSEGFNLPGSDIDTMFVMGDVDVIMDVRNIKRPVRNTTLLMETDNDHPGFTRLRLIAGGEQKYSFITYKCFESTRNGLYLSVTKYVNNVNRHYPHLQFSPHGPCLSSKSRYLDFALCFRSRYLPFKAMQWASRFRHQWPPNSTIDKVIEYGCLIVPIGPRTLPDCNLLWRISFSVAEKQLIHSFNHTQLLCYGLLKLTLKRIIDANDHANGLLCSYFLKTAIFWVSEEVDIETFQSPRLFYCFTLCIDKLILWVNNCYCPNYFIPDHNMFHGKISPDNNAILMQVLHSINIDGIDCLIQNLYFNEKYHVFSTENEFSYIELDFFFYKIRRPLQILDISRCLNSLLYVESLIKSKSSTFIIDVCKHFYAEISQKAAQLLPRPTIKTDAYNIHKRYHRHLQDGLKADAVTGWLLYASFYYATEQFEVALIITDYVLSRCSPDMLLLGYDYYNEEDVNNYRNAVHSTMTLNDRMRIKTVRQVTYIQHSSLIPRELQLELKDQNLIVHPTVMAHCLRFLCYHHLHDITNMQQALCDLFLAVTSRMNISLNSLSYSKTILGVCYEISGDRSAAYQCYDEALTCDGVICLSAKARKLKLLEI